MKNLLFVLLVVLAVSCQKESSKMYVAKITQTGENSPVANILNDDEIKVSWSRSGVGVYTGVISVGETSKMTATISAPANPKDAVSYSFAGNEIYLYSTTFNQNDNQSEFADGVMVNVDVVITEHN